MEYCPGCSRWLTEDEFDDYNLANEMSKKWAQEYYQINKEILLQSYQQRYQEFKKFLAQFHCPCFMCGTKKDLVFHHKDPKTKLYDVASMMGMKEDIILKEIAKCVSLCRTCHLKYHRILKARKKINI